MATQLTIPFGNTGSQTIVTTNPALFQSGAIIQADPVNSAIRGPSLITATLADKLFNDLSSCNSGSSLDTVKGQFKPISLHNITLLLIRGSEQGYSAICTFQLLTINKESEFSNINDLKSYFGTYIPSGSNIIVTLSTMGWSTQTESNRQVMFIRLRIKRDSQNQIVVEAAKDLLGAVSSGPSYFSLDSADIFDSVISIY